MGIIEQFHNISFMKYLLPIIEYIKLILNWYIKNRSSLIALNKNGDCLLWQHTGCLQKPSIPDYVTALVARFRPQSRINVDLNSAYISASWITLEGTLMPFHCDSLASVLSSESKIVLFCWGTQGELLQRIWVLTIEARVVRKWFLFSLSWFRM